MSRTDVLMGRMIRDKGGSRMCHARTASGFDVGLTTAHFVALAERLDVSMLSMASICGALGGSEEEGSGSAKARESAGAGPLTVGREGVEGGVVGGWSMTAAKERISLKEAIEQNRLPPTPREKRPMGRRAVL